MKANKRRVVLAVLLLWVAGAMFVPVVFLPAFGSDGHWLATAPQRLGWMEALSHFRWTEPPLMVPVMRGLRGVVGDQAILVWRSIALALHVTIALLLARINSATLWHRSGSTLQAELSLWVLGLALASPMAYRLLTSLPSLFNQLAVVCGLLALHVWGAGRRELALMLGLLAFVLVSTHSAQSQGLFTIVGWYVIWLGVAWGSGKALERLLTRYLTQGRLRVMVQLLAGCMIAAGGLLNIIWLSAYAQSTSTWQAMRNLGLDPNVPNPSVLVLNAPAAIFPAAGKSWVGNDDGLIVPDDASAQHALVGWPISQTLTFGQVLEGKVGATGQVQGMPTGYGTELRLNRTDMLTQLRQHDLVLNGGNYDKGAGFETRLVGGFRSLSDTVQMSRSAPDPYIARFESGENVILLTQLELCAPNGLALRLDVQRGQSGTVKLFRHTLHDGEQLAGNDAGLLGGLIELAEVQTGEQILDISYVPTTAINRGAIRQANAARVGLYDWQTGQRWVALHADGAQWAENAVTVARPDTLRACGQIR